MSLFRRLKLDVEALMYSIGKTIYMTEKKIMLDLPSLDNLNSNKITIADALISAYSSTYT